MNNSISSVWQNRTWHTFNIHFRFMNLITPIKKHLSTSIHACCFTDDKKSLSSLWTDWWKTDKFKCYFGELHFKSPLFLIRIKIRLDIIKYYK